MKTYLFLEGRKDGSEMTIRSFFFLRSARAALRYQLGFYGGFQQITENLITREMERWETSHKYFSVAEIQTHFWMFSLWALIKRYLSWQNLNERKNGTTGSLWRYGRCWLRRPYEQSKKHRSINLEWSFFGSYRWIGAEFGLFGGDSDRDIKFAVGLGFASVYLTFEHFLPKQYAYPRHSWEHETGISFFEDLFQIKLHYAGDDCHSCKGWKGWHKAWFLSDVFLGRARWDVQQIGAPFTTELVMTEGHHWVQIALEETTYTRPRWFKRSQRSWNITIEKGIPVPGKGENSWDCDDDAIFGLSCPATTTDPQEALNALRASVERTRQRYGGKNWQPAETVAA